MTEERVKYDQVLELFKELTDDLDKDPAERALYLLLLEHRDRMPALETEEQYQYFHKAFRQVDVMDTGNMDLVFYNLLHYSQLFWLACEEVFHDKDAYESYNERRRQERKLKREARQKLKENDDD